MRVPEKGECLNGAQGLPDRHSPFLRFLVRYSCAGLPLWMWIGCGGPWSKAQESSPRSASPPENRRRDHGSLRNQRDGSENAVGWKYRWCQELDTSCQVLDQGCLKDARDCSILDQVVHGVHTGGASWSLRW